MDPGTAKGVQHNGRRSVIGTRLRPAEAVELAGLSIAAVHDLLLVGDQIAGPLGPDVPAGHMDRGIRANAHADRADRHGCPAAGERADGRGRRPGLGLGLDVSTADREVEKRWANLWGLYQVYGPLSPNYL